MDRKEVIKKFTKLLSEDDVVVFIGNGLCKEAYCFDREGFFYLFDNYSLSFVAGIASSLPDTIRVFVIFEDRTITEDIGSIFQIYLNDSRNLFLVFLYDSNGFFKNLNHIQGVFFNIGVQSFSITNYFKSTEGLKKLKNFICGLKGPKVYSMEVDIKKNNKTDNIDKDTIFFRNRLNLFINKLTGSIA